MPKGGELHYHLAGGIAPEALLKLAAQYPYCLDKASLAIQKWSNACSGIASKHLTPHSIWYQRAIRAWSMQDFTGQQESGSDHFFASFYKFMPLIADFRPQLLANIMQRAASQHELYLEIMMLPDNAHSANYAIQTHETSTYANQTATLLKNPDFQNNIQHTIDESDRIFRTARDILRCGEHPEQSVCQLTIKFQYYLLREQTPEPFFAQALNGFEAASRSPHIIGINIVQREDSPMALKYYRTHMQIIRFLHKHYPSVHIALHAGELSPKTTAAEHLRFHIREAILTGQAERIGHGVTITYEDNAETLTHHMATHNIPVEINLTSNRAILGISGAEHPMYYYLNKQVPLVLSSDDEGILRTDLTQEFVSAAITYHLDYTTIKSINRNALTYSFLPGKSLWIRPDKAIPVPACSNFHSPACLLFIKQHQKARLQWQLEMRLKAFEANYA